MHGNLQQRDEPYICSGLSIAEVVEIKGRTLVLGGADIVDGSPILDIKPYLPFCDSLSNAIAPNWVSTTSSGHVKGHLALLTRCCTHLQPARPMVMGETWDCSRYRMMLAATL
jgi:hypothetical protein